MDWIDWALLPWIKKQHVHLKSWYQPNHTASQHTTVTFSVTGFTASPHSAISSPDEWLSTVTSTVNWLTRRQTGQKQVLYDVIQNKTLTVVQLHKNFPAFYTTRRLDKPKPPYPKPDVSNAHTHDTFITYIFMLIPNNNLEFGHPRCVSNDEVKYNEGQNTTKFIS